LSRLLAAALVLLTALGAPVASRAAWQSPGSGGQSARAISLSSGSTPSASVSNRSVAVSWTATSLPGGASVAGYVIRRYSTGGALQTIGSGCSGTVTTTSCTETGVPAGSWRYTVTPVQGNWTGGESGQSSSVTVSAPALSLSPSSVTSLPATLTGTISSFIPGQTVTFRLDDPSTGTVLSGSISPTPVASNGNASVSVTLPAGVANGSHTIYAVGSAGDSPSAGVSVAVPTTITTSAWDFRDVSTTTSVNQSAQPAFSGDGRTLNTGNWATAFSTTRYVEFDSNTTLPSGKAVSGASFDLRRAASNAGDIVCYYFEVLRISDGTPLPGGTHGSTASPVGCVTGTTQTTTSTPLPEITTTDLLNDARIRVYARSSGSRAATIDLATISGSAGSMPFTVYTKRYADAAAGGAPTVTPWSQVAQDGTAFQAGGNWATSFQAARYLQVKFPAYVPSGATVTGAILRHAYRSVTNGNNACWYAEAYSGGLLIGTYGNSAAPVGCNSSNTTWVTDSVPMSVDVNSVARANDLTVRLYFRGTAGGGSGRLTQHDFTELSLDYTE
jgi:hypothetical protein